MKKFLALLLAALIALLPAAAFADTYSITLKMDINVETARPALESLYAQMLEDASIDVESLTDAILSIMDGLSVNITGQENGCRVDVLMDGASLVDMSVEITDDGMLYVTSSLMPSYALYDVMAPTDDASLPELSEEAVDNAINAALTEFTDRMDADTEKGFFIGDAYSQGGVGCTTIRLDDADLSAILNALLTEDFRSWLDAVVGADSLNDLDAKNAEVANANAHRYVIRVVEDAEGVPIGVSVTVMRGAEQISTLSMGFADDAFKLVLGLGTPEKNYWFDMDAQMAADDDGFQLSGITREYLALRDETFAYVAETATPIAECGWSCKAGTDPLTLTAALSNDMMGLYLTVEEVQPLLFNHEAMTLVALNDTSSTAYNDAVTELSENLIVRVVQLLPMDQLLSIPQLLQMP